MENVEGFMTIFDRNLSLELSRENLTINSPKISHMYIYIYIYTSSSKFLVTEIRFVFKCFAISISQLPSQCRVINVAAAGIWLAAFGQ
jgi:hypothetical protein